MCSLVMSLCSHDLYVMLFNNNYYSSRLTYTAPGIWMVQHQLVDFGLTTLNLLLLCLDLEVTLISDQLLVSANIGKAILINRSISKISYLCITSNKLTTVLTPGL